MTCAGGYFSFKLKKHQINGQPCELEALAITAGINHFAPYIRKPKDTVYVLSDNKPCVQTFTNLFKAQFSASSRISTFLTTLSSYTLPSQGYIKFNK